MKQLEHVVRGTLHGGAAASLHPQQLRCLPSSATLWSLRWARQARLVLRPWRPLELLLATSFSPLRLPRRHLTTAADASEPRPNTSEAAFEEALLLNFTQPPAKATPETTAARQSAAAEPVAPPPPPCGDAARVAGAASAPQSLPVGLNTHRVPLTGATDPVHVDAPTTPHDEERAKHRSAELAFEQALFSTFLASDAKAHDPASTDAAEGGKHTASAEAVPGTVAAAVASTAPPTSAAPSSEKPSAATRRVEVVRSDGIGASAMSLRGAAAEAAFEQALYGDLTPPSPAHAGDAAAAPATVPHDASPQPSGATRRRAEAAFDEALYGSTATPAPRHAAASPPSAAAGRRDAATVESTAQAVPTGSGASTTTTTSPAAAAASAETEARPSPARVSSPRAEGVGAVQAHVTTATATATQNQQAGEMKHASRSPAPHPSVAEAEAAFARALYGDFTPPSAEAVQDEVPARHSAASVPGGPKSEPPAPAAPRLSLPTTAPRAAPASASGGDRAAEAAERPPLADTPATHAAAEAAFERALYGDFTSPAVGAETVHDGATDRLHTGAPPQETHETLDVPGVPAQQPPPSTRPPPSAAPAGSAAAPVSPGRPKPAATLASSEVAFAEALYGGPSPDARGVAADVVVDTAGAGEEVEESGAEPASALELDGQAAAEAIFDDELGHATTHECTLSTGAALHHEAVTPAEDADIAAPAADPREDDAADEAVDAELPLPPPTVSMHCAFARDRRAASTATDRHTLADALFGTTDHHTTAVTHVEPETRVARCMPLLSRLGKRELFYGSEWLLQLEASEVKTGDSVTPPFTHREVVGRSKVLRSLVIAMLERPELWWDVVEETVMLATHAAAPLRLSQGTGATAPSELAAGAASASKTSTNGLPEIVVTAAEVQAAMGRIFGPSPRHAQLFSDAVTDMLLSFANTLNDREKSSDTQEENAPAPAAAAASLPLLPGPVFEGPVAAWHAFVLTQRHRACGVCGPHRRPFSFGERYPTLTAADLAPLQFNNESATWRDAPAEPFSPSLEARLEAVVRSAHSAAADASAEASVGVAGAAAAAAAAAASSSSSVVATAAAPADRAGMLWDEMTEEEQNTFLFGADSARLLSMVRGRDGVYAVYGSRVLASDADYAAEEAAPSDASAGLPGTRSPEARAALRLAAARDAEAATMRAYDVDRVVLALANPEGAGVAAALPGGRLVHLAGLAGAFRSPAAEAPRGQVGGGRGRGGRGRSGRGRGRGGLPASTTAHAPFQRQLQSGEDVQLAALWQRFTRAPVGDLVSNLAHVRQCGAARVREAVVDVAVQKAFWLHFFARDEVRAITDPRRTYETVWRVHDQLRACVGLLHRHAEARDRPTGTPPPPPFESLALDCQVTYACFGMAHVPPTGGAAALMDAPVSDDAAARRCAPAGDAAPEDTDSPAASSRVCPFESPVALYTALLASYVEALQSTADFGDVDAPAIAAAAATGFATLSPLQRLAVGICFSSAHTKQPRVAPRPRATAASGAETERVAHATAPPTPDDAALQAGPDTAAAPRRRRGRPRKTADAAPERRSPPAASANDAAEGSGDVDEGAPSPYGSPKKRRTARGRAKGGRVTTQQRQARARRGGGARGAESGDGVASAVSDEDVAEVMALFGVHVR